MNKLKLSGLLFFLAGSFALMASLPPKHFIHLALVTQLFIAKSAILVQPDRLTA
jgi:hypothetical protein